MKLNRRFWWLLSLPAWLAGSQGFAANFEKEVSTLVGEWQGQGSDGTVVHMTFAAGQGNMLLTGNWKISGGNFAGESDLALMQTGGFYFLVPDSSPFTSNKEPYSTLRLPGGGMRFVRLSHVEVGNAQGLHAEEILIGKQRNDGTRTLHLVSSENICADQTVAAGKACGESHNQQIVLHKTNS